MRVRPPAQPDFEAVLELVTAADLADVGVTDWTEKTLRDEWDELDLERDAWVVEVDGRLAAYATFEDRGGGRLITVGSVRPDLRNRGVGTELIRIAERRAGEAAEQRVLQNATLADDDCTRAFYARHGYAPAQHQVRMVVDLGEELAVPRIPGIEIRLYRDPDEARTVYAVLEDAFAAGQAEFRRRSFEEWSKGVFARRDFDPTLLWVAVEDGAIVGANVCASKYAGDWGWIGALGVRPSHRGRGIGEALLRTAFAEFRRRGEARVALGVRVDNPSATRLYERAGMRVVWRITLYEKPL